MKQKELTAESVQQEYSKGCSFNAGIDLYETVEANEKFYIGRQWDGVQANGLPTPVFNFIKRIVMYLVASTATDNLKMNASPLSSTGPAKIQDLNELTEIINTQFEALFERNKLGKQTREFMRNAAVDGDACIYSWFDPDEETGQTAKGAIKTEILPNTRVMFGNPNEREPQKQPYILISKRELLEDVKEQAKEHKGKDIDAILEDSDDTNDHFDSMTEGKVTTVMRFWKENGTVWAMKTAGKAIVRPKWDTKMRLYPIVWMNWDYVQNCYHGQAAVTGLIPNQIFVNKMFAMTMISLMTTAYPKIVYDRTRVAKWDSGVGKAIPVNGGDVTNVARAIDPATISPQVGEFINLAISLTKEFMGATDAALGDTRPDNTSAIIALQKASSVPMELTKQNFYQCIEDLGNIWLDQMRVYYGKRYVDMKPSAEERQQAVNLNIVLPDVPAPRLFDFSNLEHVPMSIKLDVGGSAYWSEIAQMNTLDNLLMQGKIGVVDYLERVPNGYISNQQELIQKLREQEGMMNRAQTGGPISAESNVVDMPVGAGYGQLQRTINEGGAEGLDLSQIRM